MPDTAATLVCPTCHTHITPGERCPSKQGVYQCQDRVGHGGWHWSDAGHGELLIWTGLHYRRSCPERLGENTRWCIRTPGHEGGHTDGKGTSWQSVEEDVGSLR